MIGITTKNGHLRSLIPAAMFELIIGQLRRAPRKDADYLTSVVNTFNFPKSSGNNKQNSAKTTPFGGKMRPGKFQSSTANYGLFGSHFYHQKPSLLGSLSGPYVKRAGRFVQLKKSNNSYRIPVQYSTGNGRRLSSTDTLGSPRSFHKFSRVG